MADIKRIHPISIDEIKSLTRRGVVIYYRSKSYIVVAGSTWLIRCNFNNYCIGLTNQTGDRLNGQLEDFFFEAFAD